MSTSRTTRLIHDHARTVAASDLHELITPSQPPPAEAEQALERFRIEAQNSSTRALKDAALREPCAVHDAEPGTPCFALGGGVCQARIDVGRALWPATAFRPALAPGELHPLATAQRRATRDSRIRDRVHRRTYGGRS